MLAWLGDDQGQDDGWVDAYTALSDDTKSFIQYEMSGYKKWSGQNILNWGYWNKYSL